MEGGERREVSKAREANRWGEKVRDKREERGGGGGEEERTRREKKREVETKYRD